MNTIDVESTKEPAPPTTQAVALRPEAGALSTQRMTVEELRAQLAFIKEVMQTVMVDGQDYGKVPGCGDKPSLLQPGAQKLCMTFQLQDRVRKEEIRDFPGFHREYSFTICLVSATGKEWDGVGTCSTMEAKYRYRNLSRKCPQCGKENIRKSKQGTGWYCWQKTGGCGANFPQDTPAITSQVEGRIEHDNPADYWNTVRKIAFKRALVHAAINATNTSELWTQDVEDMRDNAETGENGHAEPARPAAAAPPRQAPTPPPTTRQAPRERKPDPAPLPVEADREAMLKYLNATPDGGNRRLVEEYFRKLKNPSVLMPNEPLEHIELRFVPSNDLQRLALATVIRDFEAGADAEHAFPVHAIAADGAVKTPGTVLPGILPPDEANKDDPSRPSLKGKINAVSLKEGTSSRGPWSKWGIKIGEDWVDTFSNTIGQMASKAKGQTVTMYYEQDQRGRKAVELVLADGTRHSTKGDE